MKKGKPERRPPVKSQPCIGSPANPHLFEYADFSELPVEAEIERVADELAEKFARDLDRYLQVMSGTVPDAPFIYGYYTVDLPSGGTCYVNLRSWYAGPDDRLTHE